MSLDKQILETLKSEIKSQQQEIASLQKKLAESLPAPESVASSEDSTEEKRRLFAVMFRMESVKTDSLPSSEKSLPERGAKRLAEAFYLLGVESGLRAAKEGRDAK